MSIPVLTDYSSFEEARKNKKQLGDWKGWMVKPKNESSAYALCYKKAVDERFWWFTSSSSALPFCRNTGYSTAGAFGGRKEVEVWKGFECTCQPGRKRRDQLSGARAVLKCDSM